MILYTCKVNKPFKGHTEGEKNMMTREEKILWELNRAEQRLKSALNVGDELYAHGVLSYISGMKNMLTLLGYKVIEDEDKAEYVGNYWIYTYKAIEDRR